MSEFKGLTAYHLNHLIKIHSIIWIMPFNPSSAEFVLYKPREQRVIFNLKLSQMSYLALSASFEYISYGHTAIINLYSYCISHFLKLK